MQFQTRIQDVKNSRWWALIGIGLLGAGLVGCGGSGGSDSGQVRLINATATHPSLDLVQVSNASVLVSGATTDTASTYASVNSGSSTALQVNDAGGATALVPITPTVGGGKHYSILAYESNSAVKVAFLSEDVATPASGTVLLRVFDAAVDAGAVDVYVTDPTADLTTLSPQFTVNLTTFALYANTSLSIAPNAPKRIRVLGKGSKTDLRLDIPSVTFADQQVATIVLTPTTGGVLVNGATLVQQSTYAATRNTSARVRLVAGAANNGVVTGTAGSTAIDNGGAQSPSVGSYVTVPAGVGLNLAVNGVAVTAPVGGLLAGSDSTLLVYDSPSAAGAHTASLIVDDNHLPTTSGNYKMRLVNAITGSATSLTLRAGASLLANNVANGVSSTYGVAAGNTNGASTVLQISSPLNANLYSAPAQSIPGNAVYSFFVFGDPTPTAVYPLFVQDNAISTP